MSGDDPRAIVPRYVKLDDVVEAVKRLFAIPPCEGAYRSGNVWAIGSGVDRSVFAGYDPTEAQVLAEIDTLPTVEMGP